MLYQMEEVLYRTFYAESIEMHTLEFAAALA